MGGLRPTQHGACAARSSASPPSQTQRVPTRQRRASHAALARSWRLQLVRRTTAVSRRGGESRRRSFFGRIRTDHNHRDTTRMRRKLKCFVSSPETSSTDAPVPQEPRGAGLSLRPQLARHTTVARSKRGVSRRCGTFLRGTNRSLPMQHRARPKQARVLRLLPRDSEHRRACAARATRRWLEVLGSSWHAALRSCAKGQKYLAGIAPFSSVSTDQDQRSTARTQKGRVLRLLPKTASAGARAPRV